MILILSHERDEHASMVQRELDALGARWHQFDLARFPTEYALAFTRSRPRSRIRTTASLPTRSATRP